MIRPSEARSQPRLLPPVSKVALDLVGSKALLTSPEFIERMHWTRQALSKALSANRVFFIELKGERYYPAFFTDPRHERRHLEAVSKALGDIPGSSKWLFFTSPKGSLSERTPLDALDRGQLAQVKTTATGYSQT